jgi:hypothetical protein
MLYQRHALYSVPLYGYFILNGKFTEDLEGVGYDGSSRDSSEKDVGNFSEMPGKLPSCERVSYNYKLYFARH